MTVRDGLKRLVKCIEPECDEPRTLDCVYYCARHHKQTCPKREEQPTTPLADVEEDKKLVSGTNDCSQIGVTSEVANKLLNIREALARNDIEEAWLWLYKIADPEMVSLTPWKELEAAASQH